MSTGTSFYPLYHQHWLPETKQIMPCTARMLSPCPACDLVKRGSLEAPLVVGMDFATMEMRTLADMLIRRDPYLRALLADMSSGVGLSTGRISSKADHSGSAAISRYLMQSANFGYLYRKSRAIGVSEITARQVQYQLETKPKEVLLQQFICQAPHGVLTITLPENWWRS